MTNPDTNTLNGSLEQLGITMADNLVTMGVSSADPSDGLTTLAGKILNVPGGSGLDLDVSATLSSDETVIDEGDSITLTSVLSASYDDETQENVDLVGGLLTGATILFKEGTTTIGTGITNSSGVATATISNLSGGSHTIKAVFAGTSVFDACESSTITITVIGDEYVEILFNGTTLTQHSSIPANPLAGANVVIDYGDGTVVSSNNYGHTYATSGDHTIKIYGVTGFNEACFYSCSGLKSIDISSSVTSLGINCFLNNSSLTSINIPTNVTSIGSSCFSSCSNLTHIYLNWSSANDIIPFVMNWVNSSSNVKFYIPHGTTSLYVAKNYPSLSLIEVSEPDYITLTSDKSILSYADSESANLTATVYDEDDNPLAGETVTMKVYKSSDDSLIETLTVTDNSDGTYSASYSSGGVGDVYVEAECRLVSETFSVQDCYYYDDCSSDKHSNWDTTNSTDTITHDSTNKHYIFTKTTNDDSFIKLTDSIIPTSVKIEYDFRVTSATSINVQPRIGLLNASTGAFIVGRHANYVNGKFIAGLGFKNNNWTEGTSVQISSLAQNNWYHIETSITSSAITINLYEGSTLLGTASMSFSDYLAQSNKLLIDSAYSKNGVWNLKNISINPL